MKVSCLHIEKLKEAYVDNMLAPEVRSAVEAHIADCELCREQIALSYRVKGGMGRAVKFTLGNPEPSRAQVAAMQAQLERRISRSPNVRLGRSSFAVAVLTLLITATAAAGVNGLGQIVLPGPALAEDQDADIMVEHLADGLEQRLHGGISRAEETAKGCVHR